MAVFENNWETLGYYRGPIDFYTINTRLFGGWQHALPREIAAALNGRFDNDLVCASRADPVRWFLRKVSGDGDVVSLAERNPIEAAATVGNGCIEHTVHWPAVGGARMPANPKTPITPARPHSGTEFFTAGGTVIIYSTWQPCLSCCNSLFSLARDHGLNFNLVVRFQRVYDIDNSGPLADATIVIPRQALLLSNATPKPADRAVFVFHDNVAELNGLGRRLHHLGEMRPFITPDTRLNPHQNNQISTDHPGGAPCGNPTFDGPYVAFDSLLPVAECGACNRQSSLSPVGSGLPWDIDDNSHVCDGYQPARHYAPNRLAF
jgi:hypothetical protein